MTALADSTTIEQRIERLSAQVEFLVEQATQAELRRQSISDLTTDLAPIASQAMESVGRRLEEADVSSEDLGDLLNALAVSLPALQAGLEQLTAVSEFAGDASQLAEPALELVTERLAELERRGYFAFMRSGAGILDRVVTTYTEDDVTALGDNIVLILDTVKEMTQPEVMTMLRRTFHTVGETESTEPPSSFALLKQMRDPQVRRGLARVLTMLRSVGDDGSTEDLNQERGI